MSRALTRRVMALALLGSVPRLPAEPGLGAGPGPPSAPGPDLAATIAAAHGLGSGPEARIRRILAASERIGTGNPAVSVHPGTLDGCRRAAREGGYLDPDPVSTGLCGAPFMAPLFDPRREGPGDAASCIDRFEFPGYPCALPLVWVRAAEASALCAAMGKRLCHAHEWEGACAGALEPPDYAWEVLAELVATRPGAVVQARRSRHNASWRTSGYGRPAPAEGCGTSGAKSPGCDGASWDRCGSNTWRTGAHPECRSPLGVYDLHGNVAEHMHLPLRPEDLGPAPTGVTEMKGSWFAFDATRPHEAGCRWRAPPWHLSRIDDPASHRNYHLGFRCCRDRSIPGP